MYTGKPDNSGLGRRLLASSYDFEQWNHAVLTDPYHWISDL